MFSSGNDASLPVLITLLVCSLLVFDAANSPQANPVAAGPRVQRLMEGLPPAQVSCATHFRNGDTHFECEADSWGKWQLSWRNPDTAEMTILQWEAHNRAIGKVLTTNPGELVVTFWGSNGEAVTKVVEVSSPLLPCRKINNCFRV